MEIITRLSYLQNTFTGLDYIKLTSTYVKFNPQKIFAERVINRERKFDKELLQTVIKCNPSDEFYVSGKDGEKFTIMEHAHSKSPQTLYWTLNDCFLDIDSLEALTQNDRFTAGHIYESNFVRWQTESSLENYIYFNKNHSALRKVNDSTFGRTVIDTSSNPGRMQLVDNMWIQAAWIMIYGNYFFNIVPKERILSFPSIYDVRELSTGAIVIKLYESIDASESKENLKIMRDFRDWINFDLIAQSV